MLYTADFETTTKAAGDATGARVWAWAVCEISNPENTYYGTALSDFMAWIGDHAGTYYFHNLRFDGQYIIDYLYKAGWTWASKLKRCKQFTTVISRMGQWYRIELLMWNPREKRRTKVVILDSLKLLPFSVADIAQAFNLDEGKGDLDYDTWRPEGHLLTDAELDYIRRDVQIMAKALKIAVLDEGMSKSTIGANALASWKKGMGKQWRLLFPKLGNVVDAQLREAYRGGFTYCMPEYRDVDIYDGVSVDYNSMYPSMMISKRYPFGEPIYFEGRYQRDILRPLYIQHLVATWTLKPDGIPFLKPNRHVICEDHEYPTEVTEPTELWITSVDLELARVMYDFDVWKYIDGYKFCEKHGTEVFGEYITYWGDRKATSTGAIRLICKLYLNNLYGKFATNPDPFIKVPVLDEGVVRLQTVESKERETIYIPLACFVTAYARDTLLRAAMANRARFVYCDTDSLHLLGTEAPEGIPLDDHKLCAWKVEGRFKHARHLRAKTYCWDLNDEFDVICAGMPDNIKEHVTWENFHVGFKNYDTIVNEDGSTEDVVRPGWGKLLAVKVDGGSLLVESKFEIQGERLA